MDPSTVQSTVKLFEETGGVAKHKYPEGRVPKKTVVVDLIILSAVLTKLGILLCEIQAEETYGIELCESSICEFLHKSSFLIKR